MSRWFRQSEEPPSPAHLDYLPRYQQLRRVGLELNNRLMKLLPKDAFQQGGRKLGILKKNTLVFGSEDEMSVLMDYCLHDIRWGGMTTIEHCLAEAPPPADSDEMLLLQALRQARFSLFAVERRESGAGAHVRDLLLDEPLFLMDVGFGKTASDGMILAARVFAPEAVYRTTGAPLLFGVATAQEMPFALQQLRAMVPGGDYRQMSAVQHSEFAGKVIRACLRSGASEHISYAEPGTETGRGPAARRPMGGESPSSRVGRNDPCPCGSGKKYKQCCMARD